MGCKIPTRYVFTIIGFQCFTFQYMLRTSLSITIVAMVNSTQSETNSLNKTNECPQDNKYENDTSSKPIENLSGEFDWDEEMQGLILSAFFWGYILPMVLSGWLASRYGGKILFVAGLGVDGVLALLIPIAARTHVSLLITCRVLMGLAEGIMIPSFHSMLGKWSPPEERSRMSSFSYAGQPCGIVLILPIAGLLCQYGFDGGWPSVFYLLGIGALICCVVCHFLVFDSPSVHPRISQKEKLYIQTNIGASESKAKFLPVPWKAILTSPPVWALSVAAFGYSWGHFTLLTQLPTYMKNVLGFNIKTNGLLSSLPYLLYLIGVSICGTSGDWIIKKKFLSVTNTRKLFQIIAASFPACCLLAITFSGCSTTLIIMWLALAGFFFGAVFTAAGCNHVDLSPNFTGILQGVTLTLGNLAGVLAPYVIGVIIQGKQTRSQWNFAYYVTSSILLLSTLIYVLFASGEQQSWNHTTNNSESERMSELKSSKSNSPIVKKRINNV